MASDVTEMGWTLTVGVQGLRYASKLFNLIDKRGVSRDPVTGDVRKYVGRMYKTRRHRMCK